MWHKVSPISFRIPYVKSWKSSWFADAKTYSETLSLDIKAREILKKEMNWIPIWDIIVAKTQDEISIVIYTAKAALILGKTWENLERLELLLTRRLGFNVNLSIKEIKKPDLNAKVVWFMVSNQIEKRMPYKRAIKQAILKTMEKWALWIKIKVWGRLNWAEIARKETFKQWNIPTQTIRSDIDYATIRAETVYGTIWLKVWIYKWQIYK